MKPNNNALIQGLEAQKTFVEYYRKIFIWLIDHPKSKFCGHESFSIHANDLSSFHMYCKENNLPFASGK